MLEWTSRQNMVPELVKVITDEKGPVEAGQIKKAVRDIISLGTIGQLIIYFAGHGVAINRSEYWLLSGAPDDSQEAVNVEGSVVLARQCTIPHVVFISDACRTAPEGIQAQSIKGSEIFPNPSHSGPDKAVDLFFACLLGQPALEVKDPVQAADGYSAIYTEAIVQSLNGDPEAICDVKTEGGVPRAYVRPWPLKEHLPDQVARLLEAKRVSMSITQTPDARITSNPRAWLSRLDRPQPAQTRGDLPGLESVKPKPTPPKRESLITLSQQMTRLVLAGKRPIRGGMLQEIAETRKLGQILESSLDRAAAAFGPTHFETECGFKIRGKKVVEAIGRTVVAELLGDEGDLVRISRVPAPAASVLLRFSDDSGVLLPAIPGFIAALSFDGTELENVSYEPSMGSWRWGILQDQPKLANELNELRTLIAASAQLGIFRLDRKDADELAIRLQMAKVADPTMALYAAYAYHALGQKARIKQMQRFLYADLKLRLFDIALLASKPTGRPVKVKKGTYPVFPLLSQGWPLLSAYGHEPISELENLQQHLIPSLWTLFDKGGVQLIRAAIDAGKIS